MYDYPCLEPWQENNYTWSTNAIMDPETWEIIKVISTPDNNYCNLCPSFQRCTERAKQETQLILEAQERWIPCEQTNRDGFNWIEVEPWKVEPVNELCEWCALVSLCTLEATRNLLWIKEDEEGLLNIVNEKSKLN